MKLLYDYQIFLDQDYGGISRYYYNLLQHLDTNTDIKIDLPVVYSDNEYLINNNFLNIDLKRKRKAINFLRHSKIKKVLPNTFKWKNKEGHENKSLSLRRIRENDFDVFHPTYYDNYFLKYLDSSKKLVITVYDMIHELYPEYFNLQDKTRISKKILINRADRIIAISNNTKNDICNIYDVNPNKIDVVYLSSNFTEISEEHHIPANSPPYILYTGSRSGYKNFYTFFYAIEPLLKSEKDIYLICTGPDFSKSEIKLFKRMGLMSQLVHVKPKNDLDMTSLYKNAEAFIFPSLYEGFGIPILEAFACKCPCILSNASSLPEIAGEAALYFNAKDYQDIYNQIKLVISNGIEKSLLINNGTKRLKEFSLEHMVNNTINTYRSVL